MMLSDKAGAARMLRQHMVHLLTHHNTLRHCSCALLLQVCAVGISAHKQSGVNVRADTQNQHLGTKPILAHPTTNLGCIIDVA